MIVRIDVRPKKAVLDPQSLAIGKELNLLGFSCIKEIHLGKTFYVEFSKFLAEKDLKEEDKSDL